MPNPYLIPHPKLSEVRYGDFEGHFYAWYTVILGCLSFSQAKGGTRALSKGKSSYSIFPGA